MTDAEQKRVFANNLTHYININGKQQNEVAKAIGEKPTTLNMCFNVILRPIKKEGR